MPKSITRLVIKAMGLTVGVILILVVLQASTPAQVSSRLESRVTQLEYEVRSLSSRLNQLASQLSGVSRSGGTPQPPPVIERPPGLGDPSLEEQFDNLAILAIEMKEDLRALERRVTALEARQ